MSHAEPIEKQKKSRVKGKCKTCGLPIPAAKRLCPACRQQEEEAKQNIHAWKSPIGEVVKRQVPRVHISTRVVFDVGRERFPIESPSGPFLETLIGVCYQRPPYIHDKDVVRYASLIDSLMQFKWQAEPWKHDSPIVGVPDVPLKRVGMAVKQWIMLFFGDEHHPLLATYALDTACCIAAHGEGKWFWPNRSQPAELPPMVDGDFEFRCLNNPGFKGDFTQRPVGRAIILAEVPDAGAVVLDGKTARFWCEVPFQDGSLLSQSSLQRIRLFGNDRRKRVGV